MRNRFFVALTLLFALLALPLVAAAQDTSNDSATLAMRLWTTDKTKASFPSVSATGISLKVGESKTSYWNLGISGGGFIVGSGSQLVMPPPSGNAPAFMRVPPIYRWRIQVTVRAHTFEATTVEIDWTRYDGQTDPPQPIAGDKRTVVLRPGERHVLEVLDFSPRNIDATNAFIEIESPRDDEARPEFANLAMAYDVWLVHETAAGQKITRRLVLAGRDGQNVPFNFKPLLLPIDADQAADGSVGVMQLILDGAIKARARSDGTFDLVVETGRTLMSMPGMKAVEGGTKLVNAKPEETVAIELPVLVKGYNNTPQGTVMPAHPRPGVVIGEDGRMRVEWREFFAGTKTSILVTVHKQ